MPRRFIRLVALGAFLLPMGAAAVAATASAVAADTRVCDQYGSISTGGKYQVMNNRWGTTATQCINVTSAGFSIVQQDGAGNLSGAPVSYPAIYIGCHYSVCSPSTNLPMKLSDITSANTNVSIAYPTTGVFNASYDIWLNADTDVSGLQDTEVMLWVNHTGSPHPVGSSTGTITLAGHSWEVWVGNNGMNNVVSYMTTGITTFNEDMMLFIRDAITRGSGFGTMSWYLTSMQMGFEPWIGGVGLAVDNFSAVVNAGIPPTGSPTGPASATPTTPPSATPTTPPSATPTIPPTASPTTPSTGAPGTCSAAIKTDNNWGTGFQATVTVTAGSSAITGWAVTWNWPGSQAITNSWNATVTSSGKAVTATNLGYNGALGAGANTTFGLQANGSNATPTLSCTANGAPPTTPPSATPTVPPTASPTIPPTATPTIRPSVTPTVPPTATPTVPPTATPTTPPTASPTTPPTGSTRTCSAAIKIDNSWGSGFQATVTVTAGSSAITGWTVTWTWPGSQAITNSWNATVTSSGNVVTAKNMSYNGSLGAGAGASFGLQVNGSSATPTLSCSAT